MGTFGCKLETRSILAFFGSVFILSIACISYLIVDIAILFSIDIELYSTLWTSSKSEDCRELILFKRFCLASRVKLNEQNSRKFEVEYGKERRKTFQ